MQVCPELEMAVSSLARFMPADYQREAAMRIIEIYEQWMQQGKDAQGVKLLPAHAAPLSPRSFPTTDAEFTAVAGDNPE